MGYTDEDRTKDFEWFLKNYDSLYKQYGHKIFAIKNGKILGVFNDKKSAITTITKSVEIGSFIVQECNGDESGYTNYISSWNFM